MAESRRLWTSLRDWAGDFAFAAVAGLCLGVVGPFGTFVEASLPFRVVYWTALFGIGAVFYGLAIRAAVSLDGRWRVPGAIWLLMFAVVASGPMSFVSANIATRVWPVLKAMSAFGWFSQSVALSVPLVVAYGALSRRLAPFARPRAGEAGADRLARVVRLPDRLKASLVCLQMEDHYVRVHSRTGSELVLISMRDAAAGLGARGRQVHRSWWVAHDAVAGVVAEGRNLRLRLVNGLEAPISRSQVGQLRAAGWLEGPTVADPGQPLSEKTG